MASSPTTSLGPDGSLPSSTTTSSSAVSATSTGQSAASEAQSGHIANLVAFGILGLYGVIFIAVMINWIVSRCLSKPKPIPTSLPPEATERGDGAFLIPTPGAAHNAQNYSRPGTSNGRSRSNTQGSTRPQRPQRPAASQTLDRQGSYSSVRSGRSVFYGNNAAALSSASMNLLPMQHGQGVSPARSDFGSRPGTARSRSSSVSTARQQYADGYSHEVPPQVPPLTYQSGPRW